MPILYLDLLAGAGAEGEDALGVGRLVREARQDGVETLVTRSVQEPPGTPTPTPAPTRGMERDWETSRNGHSTLNYCHGDRGCVLQHRKNLKKIDVRVSRQHADHHKCVVYSGKGGVFERRVASYFVL